MRFSENLKYLVYQHYKTTPTIAKDLNIGYETFRKYMSGGQTNFNTLIKIAEYFEISIDDLLTKDLENSDIIVYTDQFGDQIRKVVSKNYVEEEKLHGVNEVPTNWQQQNSIDAIIDKKIEEKLKQLLNKNP